MTRALWLVAGLAAAALVVVVSGPWLLAAWLLPDAAVLAALPGPVVVGGELTRRAVLGYNAAHALGGPAALGVVAGASGSAALVGVALLWLCHIAIDRALGYRLRPVPARPAGGTSCPAQG